MRKRDSDGLCKAPSDGDPEGDPPDPPVAPPQDPPTGGGDPPPGGGDRGKPDDRKRRDTILHAPDKWDDPPPGSREGNV
jgi:hypothetical protein